MAKKSINPNAFMDSTVSELTKGTKNTTTEKKATKTKRVTLLFREQAWSDFLTLAHMSERSANDMINDYVEWLVKANAKFIEQHRESMEALKDLKDFTRKDEDIGKDIPTERRGKKNI